MVPNRVGVYNLELEDDAMDVVWARQESAHKARHADRSNFVTARREMTQFMLAVVADTWVRELRDPDKIYTEVDPQDLFALLQAGCTGRHALDLLGKHKDMQRYHIEVEGIPHEICNSA